MKRSTKWGDVLYLRSAGLSYAEIGQTLGISRQRVRQIVSGRTQPIQRTASMLKTGEAAQLLGVHENTVRRWAAQDILKCSRIGPRRDRRFRREDVMAMLTSKKAKLKGIATGRVSAEDIEANRKELLKMLDSKEAT